ncbi:RNA polymerase-associated protein RapA [Marinicella rhabdoformis]|uniref:RNA polymerase-associated protein RapA n=1 Tax=Marinicella rhabdoformis TaxID=2580566 RepID=UPI0012AEC3AA|nr:RNA polymerase-associated protein RapA [Marinicella rhabdoformis]
MQFISGQRFINNADLQLGLGRVISDNVRMVKVAFDAVEEERVYAKDSAPLTRYEPQIEDVLLHKDGWSITINDVKDMNGLFIYFGIKENGEEDVIPETEIANTISLDRPFERLMNAQLDKNNWFDLRQKARAHQQRLQQSELYGLVGCRTTLLPHQLFIAHSVGKRYAPRVLLADEVGLGKTIEACLVIHQQLLTNRAQRVVIVVPESLTHQWMVELLRRFNLPVSVFDEEKCKEIEESSGFGNPFESAQLVLLPLEMVLANPAREEQIAAADWDLMVVDEAHHLEWFDDAHSITEDDLEEEEPESVRAYRMVEHLANKIPGVLLLTATPEQLGRKSHFARLRLLDANRYHDFETFLQEEQQFEPVADAIDGLIQAVTHNEKVDLKNIKSQLKGHVSDDFLIELDAIIDAPEKAQSLINQLLDQHGTGRVLFRNTRQSVTGFPSRELHSHALDCPDEYMEHDAETISSLTPELIHQLVDPDAEVPWQDFDPRIEWLVNECKSLAPEKLLVIASSAQTVLQLEQHFREQYGIHVAVFHEGMSLIERDQAAAWFADFDNGTQILLCSEIGSEGRNFQFAQHLLFFDLPAHPDLLEQRIGRLDRIGQSDTIHIHVPYLIGTAQEQWFKWYNQGLGLFEKTNPAAHHVYAQQCETLSELLDEEPLAQMIAQSQASSAELLSQMTRGRDRLLEYNSCRPEQAEALYEAAEDFEDAVTLEHFMHRVFDAFGVNYEEHRLGSEIIKPTDEMHEFFPFLMEEGMTITYDRDIALANENMHFITWEHPMVTEVLDMIVSQEKGNTSFSVLKNSGLKPGQMFLECRYLIQASGKSNMQLSRFLPAVSQRFLLAEAGMDVGAKLTDKLVKKFRHSVPKHAAVDVLKVKLPIIKQLMKRADDLMQQALPDLIATSGNKVKDKLNEEIKRLENLSANNAQVRPEEITHLKQGLAHSLKVIEETLPQLDSIRILVTM